MTDKELLELAAKAAGIEGKWAKWHQSYGDQWVDGLDIGQPILWNPLTDDGDALRLAVKLGISIVFLFSQLDGSSKRGVAARHIEIDFEAWGDDLEAATRRAIVRAAAEIGKTK